MMLNQKVEEGEEELESAKRRSKAAEEAYENLLKDMGEKDRFIEEMTNENVGLRLQLEQFIPQRTEKGRDILREREELAARLSQSTVNDGKGSKNI